ncbi:ClpP-like prohead protease/major capsid protein fusion protein [Exilibacterium tricleocarpae]|nr:ClpP-like prohead protease/major capsid protein fusion protein [Exilibacterium tricleocarpae]
MNSSGGAIAARNSISADGELLLYGAIGDWWDDLDAAGVVRQMEALPGDELVVRIHSGGGLIMEGLAIYNRLKQSPKSVTVHIDGIAASMASVIAMAGDRVIMPDNALMMVHKPWLCACGDAEELRHEADALDLMETSILMIYQQKTGLDEKNLADMLADETWFNGAEALEMGFADEVVEPIQAAASIDLTAVNPPSDKLTLLFQHPAASPALSRQQEQSDMNSTTKPAAKPDAAKNTAATSPATPAPPDSADVPAAATADTETVAKKAAADATAAERQRAKAVREVGAMASADASMVQQWIDDGVTVEDAREKALALVADRDDQGAPAQGHIRNQSGDPSALREALGAAMLHRAEPGVYPLDEGSAEFANLSFVEMAKAYLELNGQSVRGKNKREVLAMAMHTTSDFPAVVADVANKELRRAYEETPRTFTPIARQTTAADFKAKSSIQLGNGTGLEEVNENGEFAQGTVSESKETYRLSTFGRIFNFSRQLMINDDLDVFMRFFQRIGNLASRKESNIVWGLVNANPNLSDGNPVFGTARPVGLRNQVAGTGVTEAGLDAMRQLHRKMLGLDGEKINVAPSYLVVNEVRELAAQKILAAVQPEQTSSVNPFSRSMELIVETRVNNGTNAFYTFASPMAIDTLVYAYLEGESGPYIETKEGFEVDGMQLKVRHDFGAGWEDFRGAVRNPGA